LPCALELEDTDRYHRRSLTAPAHHLAAFFTGRDSCNVHSAIGVSLTQRGPMRPWHARALRVPSLGYELEKYGEKNQPN
jgi:hypothetical protein